MTAASLLSFAGLSLVLCLTPGPDTFLVLRFALNRVWAGIAAAAGSAVSGMLWAVLVGVGLAAVVEESAEVYRFIKIAGGLYLLYLGVTSFLRARRLGQQNVEGGARTATLLGGFTAGAVSTILNPKVGLFFLAVVPQFIPAGANTMASALLLGLLNSTLALIYLTVLSGLAGRAVAWLRQPTVGRWMERITSGILAGLGVGVVASGAAG